MFKKVENNITNSLAVIADTSSATRFALFPGCYDEARQAWKGVEAYENGTFGTEIRVHARRCWDYCGRA